MKEVPSVLAKIVSFIWCVFMIFLVALLIQVSEFEELREEHPVIVAVGVYAYAFIAGLPIMRSWRLFSNPLSNYKGHGPIDMSDVNELCREIIETYKEA